MKYSYLKRILNIPHGGYYANSLHMSIRIISRCILVLAGISLMFASGEARAATATGTPDLAVTASTLSFTGKNLKAGEKTTLKASIKNIGTQKAANVIVRFFVDGGKVYEKKVATLGKGAKSTVTYAYAIPAAAQGAFVFSVSLDPDNSIAELDEANNTAQISVPVIKATRNLVLSSLKPSNAKPKPGQKITWQLKIKNGGSVKETNVKAALYADMHSLDPTAQVVITSINPGSSVTKNLSWTVPEHLDPAIGYMVRAEADPDNAVPETSETDNVKSYSLSLTVPDISITADAGTLPNSFVYPGTFSQLFVRVKNDNVAALTNVKVAVYYALGSKSAVRTKLAETILKLPKKANVPYMFDRVFLPGSAGAGSLAYLFVVADPENAIAESNKSNNELVLQRSVVERPAQAQCPCINVAVHDEDGNPMAATVQMVRIP